MSDLNHHEFQILTTLRYDRSCYDMESSRGRDEGDVYLYLPFYHHNRLLQSCRYFDWPKAIARIQDLDNFLLDIDNFINLRLIEDYDLSSPLRVKIIVNKDGTMAFEGEPTSTVGVRNLYPDNLGNIMDRTLPTDEDVAPYVLHVSRQKIHPNPHTRVKTTFRRHYYLAQNEVGIRNNLSTNEVLLTNLSDEVMEGSYSSVYFMRHGRWVTPPLESGGQDGITRRWALERGLCFESKIMFESLVNGEYCCISNGVRGFHNATLKLDQ